MDNTVYLFKEDKDKTTVIIHEGLLFNMGF